ncbi:MAG: carboxylesterase family protein [Myxococcales bacterium]|nr:carboxylesterase family protein [Myxococcales bacterium]
MKRLMLGCAVVLAALGCDDGDDNTTDAGGDLDARPMADGAPTDGGAPDMTANDAMAPDAAPPDQGMARCPATSDPAAGLVATSEGAAQGTQVGDAWLWRALPFAAPPVGDLRWRAPEQPACYAGGVRAAADFAPRCPQLDGDTPTGDEDCLYLNIWAPAAAPTDGMPRPVMFFIHGGGNVQGSAIERLGDDLIYDGQRLAERFGVVVVSIQYRIGPLGWLVHPALQADGHFGTLDQIAALRWVQANIGAFGGDAGRVMIFGESAGGVDVCVLMSSPLAAGLFHAAAMESGGCLMRTRAEVEAQGVEQVTAAGCADDEDIDGCMRARSAAQLLMDLPPVVDVAGRTSAMQPYVDGTVLPEQPEVAMAAGRHNHVPFLVGANADETSRNVPPLRTEAAYELAVRALAGPLTPQVLEMYPAADYDSPTDALIQLTTDAKFVCGARRAARAAAAGQAEPVFAYHFAQNLSQAPLQARFGAFHGIELFFVWQRLDLAGYRASEGEEALGATLGGYWSRLATQGDVNGDGATEWPTYTAEDDAVLWMSADETRVERGLRADKCDFWDVVLAP